MMTKRKKKKKIRGTIQLKLNRTPYFELLLIVVFRVFVIKVIRQIDVNLFHTVFV